MARLIALEWDTQELRLASGVRHGSTVAVDQLAAAPLAADPSLSTEEFDARLQASLHQLVQSLGLAKSEVVIAAGRASVELRSLMLPPANDNELPEMVRFAAQRAFAQLGDTWPLDYIKLPSNEGVQVLAAATSPVVIAKAKKLSEQCGCSFKQLMLRPLSTIALTLASAPSLRDQAMLIVSVVGDEIDLVIADRGSVGLMRTARLPQGDPSFRQKALAAEIKRTRIASESQTPAVKPVHLVLWGDIGTGTGLAQGLAEQTGMSITELSLPKSVELRGAAAKGINEVERFAPVVGLLHHALHPEFPSIDFMNPRKRVEKKKPIREMAIAGVCAAALLGFGGWWYYSEHARLSETIAGLKSESKDLDATVAISKKKIEEWEKIRKFMQSDIQWLDQLVLLSDKALSADELIFGETTLDIDPTSGNGKVTGPVGATKSELLTTYEQRLRDAKYVVQGKGATPARDPKYVWSESQTVIVPARSTEEIESWVQKMADVVIAVDGKEGEKVDAKDSESKPKPESSENEESSEKPTDPKVPPEPNVTVPEKPEAGVSPSDATDKPKEATPSVTPGKDPATKGVDVTDGRFEIKKGGRS